MKKLFILLTMLIVGIGSMWATDWTPSISGFISVGNKVASITTASSASDNSHWYLITQRRDGESAIYDNGSRIMRGTTAATAASFNGKQAVGYASYLVRFIATDDEGIYNIQFGNGRYAAAYATTPGNVAVETNATPGSYAFYNCNSGTGSYFGWNLGSKTGKSVNNNGAGNTVAFWNTGERSGTSEQDNAIWYVYPVELKSTVTIDCSSSVVKMSGQGGTNPAIFYNASGDAQTSSNWYPKYITNTKIPVTIDCGSATKLSNYSGNINAYGTVTMNISVPSAYRIKSYSFGAQISNANGTAATATPAGGEAVNIDGSSVASVSASNINSSKTSITFTGTTSSGTECLVNLTTFNVVVEEISSISQPYGEEAVVVINGSTGQFTRSDGGTSTWKNQWDANDSYLPLTMRVASNNGSTAYSYNAQNIDDISFNLACGYYGATYTLTAPTGYLIKDYTLTVMTAAQAQTITPTYPSELSGTSIAKDISSPVTIKVKRIYDKTAKFKITGTNGNLKTTNFVVTLVKDGYTPDNQIYQIVCERAGLAVASGGSTLSSTCATELNLALDGSDLKQQFAFVQNDGNIYLYSVGEQKFVTKTKALKTYVGDPITIFPTGNSDYPYGFKFSDTEVLNHNSTNTTIEAWGGTTTGSLDGGNCFKLNAQGTYASMSAAVAKLKSVVYSLSDINQTTAYTISTDDRGNWYAPSSAAAITSTKAYEGVEPSSTDSKQQFAFVKDVEGFSENYYLYSVSEKKFVTVGKLEGATGELSFNRALLGAPDLNQNVTLVSSTDSKTYPSIVTVNGRNLGISTGYTPMVIDYQNTADPGNDALIVPAIDNFNPSEAQLILLQVHAFELYNTAGRLGYPKSNATVTSTLLAQAVSPTDYATLLSAYNAYKASADITTPPAGFYKVYHPLSSNGTKKYVTVSGSVPTAKVTVDDEASAIWYYTGNRLIAYSNGYQVKGKASGDEEMIVGGKEVAFTKSNVSNYSFGYMNVVPSSCSAWYVSPNTTDYVLNRWSGGSHNGQQFQVEEVTSLPVTFKKAGLGYATFHCPVAVKIPTGVEAFVSKIDKSTNKITLYRIENIKDEGNNVVIPKNTAVMLHKIGGVTNENGDVVSFEISNYNGDGITDNGFYGTTAAESMGSGTYYSLRAWTASGASEASKVGFYTKSSGDLGGFKAWIWDHSSAARDFTIVFDGESDPTGIVEALGLDNENVDIYDLNGRKLSSYRKGINIVNGKKVMIQ